MKFANTHVREFTFLARGYTPECEVIDMSKTGTTNMIGIVILPDGKFDTYKATKDGLLTITGKDKTMTPDMARTLETSRMTFGDAWRFSTIANATGGEYID